MLAPSNSAQAEGDVIAHRRDERKRAASRSIAAAEPARATSERQSGAKGAASSPIAEVISRGEALLATGDLVSARALFLYGANLGSGSAARLVARTYDPAHFRGVIGLKPNAELAAEWYRKAAELDAAGTRG